MKKHDLKTISMVMVLVISILSTGVPIQAQQEVTSEANALPSEIKIGGVFPIVKRPDAGRDRRDAFLMAVSEINNQTGASRILPVGVKLVPIVKDDDNSAAGGTAAAQALIAEGVHIVIGSSGSSVSAAMAAELGPQKIPQVSYAASSPTLSDRSLYPYFMRVAASDADQGKAVADLVQAFGWTKGASIHTSDSYGTGLVSVFTEIFNNKGTMITDQKFEPGATDVAAQIQAIVDTNPQFILGHFIDVDAATAVKKSWELGAIEIPWITTDGWSTTATFANDATVKKAMQHMIGTTPAPLTGAGYQAFNKSWFDPKWDYLEGPAFSQSSGNAFNAYAPLSYDSVYVAASGLAAANTTDGETLLNALYNITQDGASGMVRFNNLGEVIGRYEYVQLVGDSYMTFGNWEGTATLNSGEITLPDRSVWTIAENKATMKGPAQAQKESPGFGGHASLLILGLMFLIAVVIRRRKKSWGTPDQSIASDLRGSNPKASIDRPGCK
jgi:ABC-type branched-subunit amino acid transport system substrate-binding protein